MTMADIASMFGAGRYAEHAICLTNDPIMVWSYVTSDLVIWMSYMVIAGTLIWQRAHQVSMAPVSFSLFAAFIALCGITHLTDVLVIFSGVYRLDLMWRVATAVISAGVAAHHLVQSLEFHDRSVAK